MVADASIDLEEILIYQLSNFKSNYWIILFYFILFCFIHICFLKLRFLMKTINFSLDQWVGSHNPSSLRAQHLCRHSFLFSIDVRPPPNPLPIVVDIHFFLQSMWDPHQIYFLQGLAFLSVHRLVSTPFKEEPPRWHIVRCLALIPFVTAQAASRCFPL